MHLLASSCGTPMWTCPSGWELLVNNKSSNYLSLTVTYYRFFFVLTWNVLGIKNNSFFVRLRLKNEVKVPWKETGLDFRETEKTMASILWQYLWLWEEQIIINLRLFGTNLKY